MRLYAWACSAQALVGLFARPLIWSWRDYLALGRDSPGAFGPGGGIRRSLIPVGTGRSPVILTFPTALFRRSFASPVVATRLRAQGPSGPRPYRAFGAFGPKGPQVRLQSPSAPSAERSSAIKRDQTTALGPSGPGPIGPGGLKAPRPVVQGAKLPTFQQPKAALVSASLKQLIDIGRSPIRLISLLSCGKASLCPR